MKALHLGVLSQNNISAEFDSAEFPRQSPYARQSSIFLVGIHPAEKIDNDMIF